MNKELIFVYGALVKGGSLSQNMREARYIGDFMLHGYVMYRISDWYPGIIPQNGVSTLGEVYEVEYESIRKLDVVESPEYDRLAVTVSDIATGTEIKCQAYIYNKSIEGCKKVSENIWPDKRVMVMGYGSLMNTEDFMRMYTEDKDSRRITKLGKGVYKGYKLGYTYSSIKRKGGVLDVVKGTDEDYVIGVVNEMPFSLMVREIDKREGHPFLYKRELTNITINGKPAAAYCYFVLEHKKDRRGIAPDDEYNEIVLKGMHENNFPEEYIEKYQQYVAGLKR